VSTSIKELNDINNNNRDNVESTEYNDKVFSKLFSFSEIDSFKKDEIRVSIKD